MSTKKQTSNNPTQLPPSLPSILGYSPVNLTGGVPARKGFAYQDAVAVHYYLQMLSNKSLVSVSCETDDDISLIWEVGGEKIAEFVQVKAEHPDQLWTTSKLCERSKSKTNKEGLGTSILEKSLENDRFKETSWFSIVTCRQISSALQLLTRERGHDHRKISYSPFKDLVDDINKRVSNFQSLKGNTPEYWLINTYWNVIDEDKIDTLNKYALTNILRELVGLHDLDLVEDIYENLRRLAKHVAELGIEDWDDKRITADQLLSRIKEWIQPFPKNAKAERLELKMTEAGLDSTCLSVAKDQQRYYLRKRRTPEYLSTQQAEDIEQNVLSVLHSLRSSLDSDKFADNGVEFHDRCLKAVEAIPTLPKKAKVSFLPSYLAGCMYEITSRCRHRFTRIKV